MNGAERLVEAYYRQKGHFTATDVKVENGNNRQFDILTYDSKSKEFYHVEVSVTHGLNWIRSLDLISVEMQFKFFGLPKNKRPGNSRTDHAKGKTYLGSIKSTYSKFGIDFEKVNRVWCTWHLTGEEHARMEEWKNEMAQQYKLSPDRFHVLQFRDEVLTKSFE